MSFVLFVIYMYAVQKEGKQKLQTKNKKTWQNKNKQNKIKTKAIIYNTI